MTELQREGDAILRAEISLTHVEMILDSSDGMLTDDDLRLLLARCKEVVGIAHDYHIAAAECVG